jgi:prepilin peptidase CpaA
MTIGTPELVLVAGLSLLLLTTCVTDWRHRDIPNWLTGAIALTAPLYWWATGIALWPDVALHLGIAAIVLGVLAALFAAGAMGGGDVKLLVALALWIPGLDFMRLLIVMSIAGGVLTLAFLIRHKVAKIEARPEIPYGIAIAFAGLWVLSQRYLNHFV